MTLTDQVLAAWRARAGKPDRADSIVRELAAAASLRALATATQAPAPAALVSLTARLEALANERDGLPLRAVSAWDVEHAPEVDALRDELQRLAASAPAPMSRAQAAAQEVSSQARWLCSLCAEAESLWPLDLEAQAAAVRAHETPGEARTALAIRQHLLDVTPEVTIDHTAAARAALERLS